MLLSSAYWVNNKLIQHLELEGLLLLFQVHLPIHEQISFSNLFQYLTLALYARYTLRIKLSLEPQTTNT